MFVQLRWSTFPTFVRDVGSKSTWVIVRKHTELARFQRCQGELKTSDTPAPTSLMFERNHLPEHPFLSILTWCFESCMQVYILVQKETLYFRIFLRCSKPWMSQMVGFGGSGWWLTVLSRHIRHILQVLIKVPCNQSPSDWCKETIENQQKTPTNNYLV